MATYEVRLAVSNSYCYLARVSFPRGSRPTRKQLAAAASREAVAAFGRQARGWRFIDSRRVGR
jgi:hypothetical protein